MILMKKNIESWKKDLDAEFQRQTGTNLKLSETMSNDEWLEYNEGTEIRNAIEDELDAWWSSL